jgi:hypothetical protein
MFPQQDQTMTLYPAVATLSQNPAQKALQQLTTRQQQQQQQEVLTVVMVVP